MRKGKVFFQETFAGIITENEDGIHFEYDKYYVENENSKPISLTLPLQHQTYTSKTMIPFFDGLIPEGWLLDIAEMNWKISERDRMGLLLAFCKDCIGAISIVAEDE